MEGTVKLGGVAVAVMAAAAAVVLAACGGGRGTQPVHGQILGGTQSAATVAAATGGITGICGGAVAGTQVIVKGPSGTLLATTTLHKAKAGGAMALAVAQLPSALTGPEGQVGVYEFNASIPAGKGPYTIDVVGVNSIVVSKSDLAHLQLTC
jgi:hypothetical protein